MLSGWIIRTVLTVLIFHLSFPVRVLTVWWWASKGHLTADFNSICRNSRHVGPRQQEICLDEPEIVKEIAYGTSLATEECQFQFRERHWNCSDNKASLRKVLTTDTRESAFVRATNAAAAMHAVAEACSSGRLLACSCDNPKHDVNPDDTWVWGGCADDVGFAYLKAKEFLDVGGHNVKGSDFRTHVHLHNNEAGRLASKNYMRNHCKCHGLSGSCTLKTCWRKMPLFSQVGERLKSRFDGAVRVSVSNPNGSEMVPSGGRKYKAHTPEDLVYVDKGPNFCKPGPAVAWTTDRTCVPGSEAVGGCDILCCNRGYSKEPVTIVENCQCKFRWCCEVVCQSCPRNVTITRCR